MRANTSGGIDIHSNNGPQGPTGSVSVNASNGIQISSGNIRTGFRDSKSFRRKLQETFGAQTILNYPKYIYPYIRSTNALVDLSFLEI